MSQPISSQPRLDWIDRLRVFACFLVLLAHSCDPFVGQLDQNRSEFLAGAIWGSAVRSCVPLFVILTGVLLLPLKTDMFSFYKRRIGRLLIPLISWSLLLPLFFFLYFQITKTCNNPNLKLGDFTAAATLGKFSTWMWNFSYDTIPLWYLYMLIGLYFILPILHAWLKQATQVEIKKCLWIWVFTTCVPYLQLLAPLLGYRGNGGNLGLFGVCDWNVYGSFYYISGFAGYLVLAHYFTRFPLAWSLGKRIAVGIPMFLVGFAITLGGFLYIQKTTPGNFARLEIAWYFTGINVFLMTFPVFLIFQGLGGTCSALTRKIASLSFGVYLCHFVFIEASYQFLHPRLTAAGVSALVQIPLIASSAFVISLALCQILSLIPVVRKIIS